MAKKLQSKKTPTTALSQHSVDIATLVNRFYQVVGDVNSQKDSQLFLNDFLTESEITAFAKRLAIAVELDAGKSYDKIRQEYGVSTATISVVSEMISKPGMQLALKKVKTDNWAEQMSEKIVTFLKK